MAAESGLEARICVGAGRDLRRELEIGTGIYEERCNARPERATRRESEERREEINRGEEKAFFLPVH